MSKAIALPMLLGVLVVNPMTMAQPPRPDQPTPRAGTGVIRGRVIRADTGEPVRRAEVRLEEWTTVDHGGPAAIMTDAEGRYELAQLSAGRYHLRATRGGYVEVSYGQRRPFERGRPLELGEGAVLQNIDFALTPGAVITGHVVDEAGEAIPHASVSLARRRYINGARALVSQNAGSTDDRGEFRIFGVPPGEYVIVAKFGSSDMGSRDRVRYVPTYYPGTPEASEAQPVTLGPGQELAGIAITIARAAAVTVRGTVRSAGPNPVGLFTFVSAREIGGPEAYGQSAMAVASADGSFALNGLLPGTYRLAARSSSEGEFGLTDIVVDGSDLDGVTVMLSKGATARGRIRFDMDSPPPGLRPSQIFVVPAFMDQHQAEMQAGLPPVTRDDWTFELPGLRGRGFIRAGTMTGWQLKRVRQEGVDVTDTPLDFAKDLDGLEVELTQRLTEVSGSVSDDRGTVLDTTIVAFAEDAAKWGAHSRFVQSARPDQQGRFTIRHLPPGRYLAIAVAYLEPGEEQDPELLEGWRRAATSFTLSDGETRVLDLKLSPL